MSVVQQLLQNQADILRLVDRLWWMMAAVLTFVVCNTAFKLWLDRRQERRFREMLRLAGIHGKVSDAQAGRVNQAAANIEEKYDTLAVEVHDTTARVRTLTHAINNVLSKLPGPAAVTVAHDTLRRVDTNVEVIRQEIVEKKTEDGGTHPRPT